VRCCDPGINQFTQPDTLIPDLYNPLDWNRNSYTRYNPLKYTDPSGHAAYSEKEGECGPVCLMKHLGYNADNALKHYFKTHPDYVPADDPAIDNQDMMFFIAATQQASQCEDQDCDGWAVLLAGAFTPYPNFSMK